VKSDSQSRQNADHLASALAHRREGLAELENPEQRSRREQAIEQMATYVSMLRDTSTPSASLAAAYGPDGRRRRPFTFKLEFADGRWSVDEKELETAPQVGDIISFEDGTPVARERIAVRSRTPDAQAHTRVSSCARPPRSRSRRSVIPTGTPLRAS